MTMKKVITYGTFDLLHWGHIKLLERAKQLGDYLVVAISTDEFNLQKQKKAYHSYEHRKLILETIRYVDEVIPEKNWDHKVHEVSDRDSAGGVRGGVWEGHFDFLSA